MKMEYFLKAGEILSRTGSGRVVCQKGSLWITSPGSRDILLKDKEEVIIKSRGKILIENIYESPALLQWSSFSGRSSRK